MGPVMQADVEHRIKRLPGVESVDVEVVFEPRWDLSMMSESARLELGM
jgi:metal-sulfur cluster biosynthetic enzyme